MNCKQLTPYVLGLMFDGFGQTVLLIRKKKPRWQAGLLNGIGGKIEGLESACDAIVREFKEEAGYVTKPEDWREFCVLRGDDFVVFCLTQRDDCAITQSLSQEEEKLERVEVSELQSTDCVSNLPWLIHMALDTNYGKEFKAVVNYSEEVA